MIVSKWLVDEELSENSSLHFELISIIVIKGLRDQDENAHQFTSVARILLTHR